MKNRAAMKAAAQSRWRPSPTFSPARGNEHFRMSRLRTYEPPFFLHFLGIPIRDWSKAKPVPTKPKPMLRVLLLVPCSIFTGMWTPFSRRQHRQPLSPSPTKDSFSACPMTWQKKSQKTASPKLLGCWPPPTARERLS